MTTAQTQTEDFKTLFEEHARSLNIKEGEVLKGTVVEIRRDHVMVDIGFKSEGLVNVEEFRDFDGKINLEPGEEVDVVVEQLEDKNGMIVLSKERADALRSWDRVADVYENEETIEGVIINKIKGGMSVNLGGIKAFLPASQIDLKPIKSLDKLIGQKFSFKILKLNKAKGNIVLSRRVVLETERASLKQDLLENLKEGQVLDGVVKNITDYGAFVDLGGVDGLLHITDLTWGRVGHPSEILKVGDEVEVCVLKYEKGSEKVSLGMKQLKQDPWQEVNESFTPGEKVKGKVVNVTDYGVFVELAEGIEGLVHVSELTWNKKIKHPSQVVKQGEEIEAVILDIDSSNRRISLGVKQLEENPWVGLEQRYPAGTKVKGVVRNITDFGLFIGVEGEEIDGLVHISDLTWDRKIKHPSELYEKGNELEAVVISVDKENERFALGIKQLVDDPLKGIKDKYSIGQIVTVKVLEVGEKGLELDVGEEGWSGYINNADLSAHERIRAKEKFAVGEEITAQVKKVDDKSQRIIMSVKNYEKVQEKENMKDFLEKQGDATVSLGESLKPSNS